MPPRPLLQPFDSGKLAPRVGSHILPDGETFGDDDARLLIEQAADAFDLIWIEASRRLETTLLDDRGTIVELHGDRDTALSKVQLAALRYDVRELESEADWATLEELMRFAPSSRFASDPHIPQASFRRHKLSLLKVHVQNRGGLVSLAYPPNDPARAVGYHCTSLDADRNVVFYDLAVDPEFRRGFVALNLIRYNLERFAAAHPDARRLTVRIYDDNTASLRLFANLGLEPTGRRAHGYHWIL